MNSILEATQGNLERNLEKWLKLINEIHDKTQELWKLNKEYESEEMSILNTTDFKELYGANNDKIRRAHVKKTLEPLIDDKKNLELELETMKRQVGFLEAKTYATIELLKIKNP